MADSYILFRQGKTPVGPFITLKAATNYILNEGLLGYAVLPMKRPDLAGTGNQNVVGSGSATDSKISHEPSVMAKFLAHKVGQFGWDHQYHTKVNLQSFMSDVLVAEPGIRNMKITLIKSLRHLASLHGYELGLAEAKRIVDGHPIMSKGE